MSKDSVIQTLVSMYPVGTTYAATPFPWSLNLHTERMVFAMLSNNRSWEPIAENFEYICNLFHQFDADWIKHQSPDLFIQGLRARHLGNRQIAFQMNSLKQNIETLERIAQEHGSIDGYFQNMVKADKLSLLVKQLSEGNGKYKLKGMGVALVCEYLKCMFDCVIKPDVHVNRFFSLSRLGWVNKQKPSVWDSIDEAKILSDETGISAREIDLVAWEFCREHCGADPDCDHGYACPFRKIGGSGDCRH